MGRKRTCPASISASNCPRPSRWRWLVKSTSKIAFFVTNPISMMKPITEKMFRVLPVMRRASSTPIKESGSDTMMAIGCKKLPNCDASTR